MTTAVFALSSICLTKYGPSAVDASLCRDYLSLFFSERKKTKSPFEIFSAFRCNLFFSCVYTALWLSISDPLLPAPPWRANLTIALGSYEPSMARIVALVEQAVLVVFIALVQMVRTLSTFEVDSYTRM